ncbi:unnamed protein product [Pedinophyceae sp. YPF-701]|nr:unnamed protein product [Pedinophyceae sp. YPF-701]
MISQLFVLSLRGDPIIRRDYLDNVPKNAHETFFRKVRFWGQDGEQAPPVFQHHGASFIHLTTAGLHFLATTKFNVSATEVLELLHRLAVLLKDFCGVLSEEALRLNFSLCYEIVDEAVDMGLPQLTTTEALRPLVLTEPKAVMPASALGAAAGFVRGPVAAAKSVLSTGRTDGSREEIYVDVVERISATFDPNGLMVLGEISGAVTVRSFLTSMVPIRIALSPNLVVGRGSGAGGYGHGASTAVVLDDCNFHPRAQLDTFETERTIVLTPPEGEFAVMNYRTSAEFPPPFRAVASADISGGNRMDVALRVRCTLPKGKFASGVAVRIPVPPGATRVSFPEQSSRMPGEWLEKEQACVWTSKKVAAGTEVSLRCVITFAAEVGAATRRQVGPVSLQFTVPTWAASGLAVRYLQVMTNDRNYKPSRWVRYASQAASYVQRI